MIVDNKGTIKIKNKEFLKKYPTPKKYYASKYYKDNIKDDPDLKKIIDLEYIIAGTMMTEPNRFKFNVLIRIIKEEYEVRR